MSFALPSVVVPFDLGLPSFLHVGSAFLVHDRSALRHRLHVILRRFLQFLPKRLPLLNLRHSSTHSASPFLVPFPLRLLPIKCLLPFGRPSAPAPLLLAHSSPTSVASVSFPGPNFISALAHLFWGHTLPNAAGIRRGIAGVNFGVPQGILSVVDSLRGTQCIEGTSRCAVPRGSPFRARVSIGLLAVDPLSVPIGIRSTPGALGLGLGDDGCWRPIYS